MNPSIARLFFVATTPPDDHGELGLGLSSRISRADSPHDLRKSWELRLDQQESRLGIFTDVRTPSLTNADVLCASAHSILRGRARAPPCDIVIDAQCVCVCVCVLGNENPKENDHVNQCE